VLSGVTLINRNGLRWCDASAEYRSHKTLYSWWKRWSEKGIFVQMLPELADQGGGTDTLMIDATHLKTHRTASNQVLKNRHGPQPACARW
jgi:transposase